MPPHNVVIEALSGISAKRRELDDLHSDPVDRLLISQAKLERMRIVSTDPSLGNHGVEVIDAIQ
jgi:PIN domain nuclease of toxin-antitoxin system